MDYGYLHHIVSLGDGSYGPVEDLYFVRNLLGICTESSHYQHQRLIQFGTTPNFQNVND